MSVLRQFNDGLLEFAREFEGDLFGVVLAHRSAGVLAAVERFIEREAEGQRPFDASGADDLAIQLDGARAAFAEPAIVLVVIDDPVVPDGSFSSPFT